jgi:HPt (histidine-containing phosphotransfer) domain-containing protein
MSVGIEGHLEFTAAAINDVFRISARGRLRQSLALQLRAQEEQPMAKQPVVDLDQLARQTGGDDALGREVLRLFVVHASQDVDRLAQGSGEERRALAHRLLGSASAVGAHEVGRLAAAVEAGGDADVPALAEAMAAVVRFIEDYLAG